MFKSFEVIQVQVQGLFIKKGGVGLKADLFNFSELGLIPSMHSHEL